MTEDVVHLVGAIGPCPACGGLLRAVTDAETTNLLCAACGACWHDELGWIRRVDPGTCPGCASRAVCAAALRPYGAAVAG